MSDSTLNPFRSQARSHWIRLRTLIVLRWIAISGQLVAITIADALLDLQMPLGLCYLAVSASVMSNIVAMFAFPENMRLTEGEVVSMLLFDISQLCFLLYLTGGLNNPFALLVLAPVTISASVLRLQSTVILGGTALVMISAVSVYHIPLRSTQGDVLRIPSDFLIGFWIAIVTGLSFIAGYARRISIEIHSMSDALLATQMALVREQKLTDLGGVVAAAAHELGTPLATIKLVSAELADELGDRPEHRDDALLIRREADRCAEILRSMGRAGKDDLHLRVAPVSAVLREAAEPHLDRGRDVRFELLAAPGTPDPEPTIRRRPEIIHGLRNLIQNAVDFSHQTVWVEGRWTRDRLTLRIVDDGAGFPPHLLGRIGDPFIRRRPAEPSSGRPEYDGMGLGLFIAKTLLERTGAEITFANGSDPFLAESERPERCGAVVEVIWPLSRIAQSASGPLGENVLN